ncbi:MAG: shikimate dehydrogenase [Gallionellales bacterium 35-53-114]|jgi:shikimate dehydrogenase|nr:MAG: shikimate dehydrogenase [Gallionellales bacterium 35-53-114]OYZ64151.1 MAG: shikimate dehydrogenase [Gallionellales bacterium 24-53-125]OZB10539.1 MAG: shikimate dehydrogenase [Gallionellales bacterium 39-52-133]HQS57160.1 shikimate dehydrogenase [Gallionellaceae bacterium]HQS74652.1 shikimate dehydrogenase [Gallionellaceae bacterium]
MTDKYAVIGNPVSHSKSPLIHKMFAEQTGQDMSYEAIEAPLDGFAATIQRLRDEGYKGCNITVPFKHEAYTLANEHSGRARAAHAVNTFLFQDGAILGDNTDGIGLVTDIEQNLGCKFLFKRVLLMGAGGAAHGVIWHLFNAGAAIIISNRTMDKAEQLAAEFEGYGTVFAKSYAALAGQQFDIVINATSSSLADALPPLPDGLFKPGALAYDMMYGKQTPFLRFAQEQGAAQLADGLGMLVEQAAVAFQKWRGVSPDTAPVIARLRA